MSALGLAESVWLALSPAERESLVSGLLDTLQGKPPKAVRIAELRKRKILALAKVQGRL